MKNPNKFIYVTYNTDPGIEFIRSDLNFQWLIIDQTDFSLMKKGNFVLLTFFDKKDIGSVVLDRTTGKLLESFSELISEIKKKMSWGQKAKIIISIHWGGKDIKEYKTFLKELNEKNIKEDYFLSYWGSQSKSYKTRDLDLIKKEMVELALYHKDVELAAKDELSSLLSRLKKSFVFFPNWKDGLSKLKEYDYNKSEVDSYRFSGVMYDGELVATSFMHYTNDKEILNLPEGIPEYDSLEDGNEDILGIWMLYKFLLIKKYHLESTFRFPKVIILFVCQQDLISERFIQCIYNLRSQSKLKVPIITICDKRLKDVIKDDQIHTEPRIKYLDHSIWNYFFGLEDLNLGFFFSNHKNKDLDNQEKRDLDNGRFEKVIEFIRANSNKKLKIDGNIRYSSWYRTNVAREFVEFHNRLLLNSRIEKLGGHSDHVTPFVFHSESDMMQKYLVPLDTQTESIYEQIKLKKISWRILLVDDHIKTPLSPFWDQGDQYDHLSKAEILRTLLMEDGWDLDNPRKETSSIFIECVENVEDAKEKLQEGTYDIILLDFLLGYDENNEREYGYQLLKNIDDHENLSSRKNPLNYYWILIISAFPHAFFDKLREQRLSYHSNHWHLARGADPINTPELFKYSLYRLMQLQIEEVDFTKQIIAEHFRYQFISARNDEIREWAKSYYQIFISKFGKIHILKNDHTSLFSKTYCDYFSKNRVADMMYYEKMKNFLFLLANGSANDSGQLQMSYMEVSKEMNWTKQENEHERRLLHYINTMRSENQY